MSNKIDLHIHSTYSDGTETPKAILDKAKELGIDTVSITDHDTIDATKEAKEYAKKLNINYINGVELSAYSVTEIHILGYGFDENNAELIETLEEFSQKRQERVTNILEALAKYKIYINKEDLPDSKSIGRLHVAKALQAKGYVSTIPEAFDKYLGANGITYFPSKRITPLEAVQIIKKAGGIPVLAHPLRFLQSKKIEDLIIGLKPYGLGGIEAYYNTHDELTCKKILDLAKKYKLIATGGTDYHGKNRNQELGSIEFNLDNYTKQRLGLK